MDLSRNCTRKDNLFSEIISINRRFVNSKFIVSHLENHTYMTFIVSLLTINLTSKVDTYHY